MNNNSAYQKLMRLNTYIFTTTLLIFFLVTQVIAAPTSSKAEMSFDAYDASHWQSSVVTFNGNIYLVWVDNKMRTMIAKKSPNGKISQSVIISNTDRNKNHTLPSVAVDKNGYIHVAYNMHQSRRQEDKLGWQYKVSNKPEDITSFTFLGNNSARTIPGKFITYPSFIKDNNGDLYVTFRHRTPDDGRFSYDGSQGIGIAKYNSQAKKWNMLGGTNYKHGRKTFFWSNSSAKSNRPAGYQGYRAKIFFDRKNNMHVSWDVFIKPGRGRSHIMYAYSDNGGKTFKKANGQTISSLPITPNTADIVDQDSKGIFHNQTFVGVTKDNQPMVSYRIESQNKSYYKIWNGKNWGKRKELPASYPGNFITDSNGVITAVKNNKFIRSNDKGQTWKIYPIANSSKTTSFDYDYLSKSNKLRFQTMSGNKIKVSTVSFSDSDVIPTATLLPPKKITISQERN